MSPFDNEDEAAASDAVLLSSSSSSSSSSSGFGFFIANAVISLGITAAYILMSVYQISAVSLSSMCLLLYSMSLVALTNRLEWNKRIKKLPRKHKLIVLMCSVSLSISVYLSMLGLQVLGCFRWILFGYSGLFIVYSSPSSLSSSMIGARRLSLSQRPSAKRRTASMLAAFGFVVLVLTSSSSSSALFACLALMISSTLGFIRLRYMRHQFAKEFGSLKRLQCYSVVGAAVLLSPFSLLNVVSIVRGGAIANLGLGLSALVAMTTISLYLQEELLPELSKKIEKAVCLQSGFLIGCSCGLLSSLWCSPSSVGVSCLVSAALIFLGIRQLTGSPLSSSLSLPRHLDGGSSASAKLRNWLKQVLEVKDTRRIAQFLCLNFVFTLVEVVYGYWTNSLGLISDAAHMMFDCTALVIGLYASTTSRRKPNQHCTFGFARYEVVSGLVNAIFLVFIAFSVLVESVERVLDPPDIRSAELLTVSVIGLLVNIVGIVFFHDAHGHSHAHGGHGGHAHNDSAHNTNMEGIYLHVLADALGSVGVIASSLMVHYWGWLIADPICSILISILIMMSVYPLLKQTSLVLLQVTPPQIHSQLNHLLHRATSISGVLGHRDAHFWMFTPGSTVGHLHLQVEESANEQQVLNAVNNLLRSAGVSDCTVQLEKKRFIEMLEPETRTRYHMHDPHWKAANDHAHHHQHGHSHSHSHTRTH